MSPARLSLDENQTLEPDSATVGQIDLIRVLLEVINFHHVV